MAEMLSQIFNCYCIRHRIRRYITAPGFKHGSVALARCVLSACYQMPQCRMDAHTGRLEWSSRTRPEARHGVQFPPRIRFGRMDQLLLGRLKTVEVGAALRH